MVVCVKMMSKGSKGDLTVLIVTHVIVLMSKGSKVVFVAYVLNIDTFNAMSKGLKKALTVLIVTHVTHVERVKSGVCGLCTQYRYIQCYVESVERLCYVETRDKHVFPHNFLNIQAIFNLKKVLES